MSILLPRHRASCWPGGQVTLGALLLLTAAAAQAESPYLVKDLWPGSDESELPRRPLTQQGSPLPFLGRQILILTTAVRFEERNRRVTPRLAGVDPSKLFPKELKFIRSRLRSWLEVVAA